MIGHCAQGRDAYQVITGKYHVGNPEGGNGKWVWKRIFYFHPNTVPHIEHKHPLEIVSHGLIYRVYGFAADSPFKEYDVGITHLLNLVNNYAEHLPAGAKGIRMRIAGAGFNQDFMSPGDEGRGIENVFRCVVYHFWKYSASSISKINHIK
jgi:hypothetical protein